MKRFYLAGLGLTAAVALSPLGSTSLRNLFNAETTWAGVAHQPQVQLQLAADKQIVQTDPTGTKVTWQAVANGKTLVQPGDVIRYTISGANGGDRPASNLTVVQPIPKGTVYLLNSANGNSNNGTVITYSIDNGKNFVATPTVTVVLPDGKVETRPAPATAYTSVRWNFSKPLNPGAKALVAYQVKVQE